LRAVPDLLPLHTAKVTRSTQLYWPARLGRCCSTM